MASAMEAKIVAQYINAQRIMEFQTILTDMGHPQPPTVIRMDYKTACGIVNGTMKQNNPRPLICVSIGSKIAFVKNNNYN